MATGVGSKSRSVYRCTECGDSSPKWAGRCEGCGAWNTLVEEVVATPRRNRGAVRPITVAGTAARLADVAAEPAARLTTGLVEFDHVLGGGIVPGSLVLVGGEPGIGKSTLLMQCAARLEREGVTTLYVSGEESPEQLRLRANRLGPDAERIHALAGTLIESMIAEATALAARVVIVDSIQTSYTDELEGAPGNVGQVRECAARLMRFAKDGGPAVFLVGHVTKGGGLAGPKTLEHIVDTVLYFQGEGTLDYRLLRATKNRFGAVDEIGVFELTAEGLRPVESPSATFLSARASGVSGSAITALVEGTRPLLVEIQALATKAGFGTPQRVATGLDHRRLAVLLAVLERRAGIPFGQLDVFVNVTGGARLQEPSADLAVMAALCSAVLDRAAPADALFVGEVGLGGEVRPAAALDRRLSEGARLGFRRAYVSARARVSVPGISLVPLDRVGDLAGHLAS